MLQATPAVISAEVEAALADFGAHPGHVFNLGHGVTPDVDPERVKTLVDAVHATGRRIRGG